MSPYSLRSYYVWQQYTASSHSSQLVRYCCRWEPPSSIRNGSRRVNRCIITVARATTWKVRGEKKLYVLCFLVYYCVFRRGENTLIVSSKLYVLLYLKSTSQKLRRTCFSQINILVEVSWKILLIWQKRHLKRWKIHLFSLVNNNKLRAASWPSQHFVWKNGTKVLSCFGIV